MTRIRKMVTFPARAAELLALATGDGKERAAGEYLGAVLAQRHRSWTRALDLLQGAGYTRAELRALLQEGCRRGYTEDDYTASVGPVKGAWLADLQYEFDADNRALFAALSE